LVNPAKWPLAKYGDARIWHEWLTSKAGLDTITSYKINGEQLLFPPRAEPISNESTTLLNFSRADNRRVFP
jgi:ABC-type tungstate transport system permease subunit